MNQRPSDVATVDLGVTIIYLETLFQGVYWVKWRSPDYEWGLETKFLQQVQAAVQTALSFGTCDLLTFCFGNIYAIEMLNETFSKSPQKNHSADPEDLELSHVFATFIWQLYSPCEKWPLVFSWALEETEYVARGQ